MEEERGESCFVFHFSDIVFLSNYFFFFVFFLVLQIWRKSTSNVIFVRGTHSSTRRGEIYFDRILFIMKVKDTFVFASYMYTIRIYCITVHYDNLQKKIKEKNEVKSLLIFHSHPIFDELCSVKLSCLNIYIKTNN